MDFFDAAVLADLAALVDSAVLAGDFALSPAFDVVLIFAKSENEVAGKKERWRQNG